MTETEQVFNVEDQDGDLIEIGILHNYDHLNKTATEAGLEPPYFTVRNTARDEDGDCVEVFLTASQAQTLIGVLTEALKEAPAVPPSDPVELERWLADDAGTIPA